MGLHHNRSKRGLSTVVTGVIMLSAVAVLGTAIVAWSNSNLFANQQILSTQLAINVNKIKESVKIENVWFQSSSPKFVNVTLSNLGTIGVNVTEVSFGNHTSTHKTTTITNGGILPGQTWSYKSVNYDWQNNSTVKVSVTTARDNIISTEASP